MNRLSYVDHLRGLCGLLSLVCEAHTTHGCELVSMASSLYWSGLQSRTRCRNDLPYLFFMTAVNLWRLGMLSSNG